MPMPAARTLPALLDEMATRLPAREFLVDGERRWSYGEFRRDARALAKGLLRLGLRRGDRLALLMGNCAEWLLVDFAAMMVGATVVAVNTWFRDHELGHVLRHSDCAMLVMVDRYLGHDYRGMLRRIGPLPLRVISAGAAEPDAVPFTDLCELGREVADGELDAILVRPDDIACILYTSGTTALPKGAQLCHGGIVENGFNIGERQHLGADDRLWMGISLFWSFACINALPAVMTHGGALVLQPSFVPGEALALIEREHCTVYYGTPNMTLALVEHPERRRRDLSSLRTGLTIGGPRAVRLAVELGVQEICQCYGLTEVYGNCAVADAGLPLSSRENVCGRALPGTEIIVADPVTHAPLPPGEVGEFKIRGHVMPGYFADPERTAAAFDEDGYFLSGDLGRLDADGQVHFHSRLKEMLKSGGILFAPQEVEEFVAGLPEVGEAHAVAVPDPRKDEVVACAVLLKEGAAVTAADLARRCREGLAAYKVPAYWWLVRAEELPRTATGKVQKFRLRELFLARLGGEEPGCESRSCAPATKS